MICFVVLLVCFLEWGGGGGGQWVGAITFTKDGIFTSCTNEMNILWYKLYKKNRLRKFNSLWVIVKHACFNNLVGFCYTFILSETMRWGTNRPARTDDYSPDLYFILKTINAKHAQQYLLSLSATETFL